MRARRAPGAGRRSVLQLARGRAAEMYNEPLFPRVRAALACVVESDGFASLTVSVILLNAALLSVEHAGMAPGLACALELSNAVFTGLFTVELLMKVGAFGWRRYLSDPMNFFDAAIVAAGLTELAVGLAGGGGVACVAQGWAVGGGTGGEGGGGGGNLSSLRMLRILRVFRSLKLMQHWSTLSRLVKTLTSSSAPMVSCFALLLVFSLIFALFGMELYGGGAVGEGGGAAAAASEVAAGFGLGDIMPHSSNFDSAAEALLSIFEVVTGEGMWAIMYALMDADKAVGRSPVVGAVYIVVMWFVCNFVTLNIFLAILVHQFSNAEQEDKAGLLRIEEGELAEAVLGAHASVLLLVRDGGGSGGGGGGGGRADADAHKAVEAVAAQFAPDKRLDVVQLVVGGGDVTGRMPSAAAARASSDPADADAEAGAAAAQAAAGAAQAAALLEDFRRPGALPQLLLFDAGSAAGAGARLPHVCPLPCGAAEIEAFLTKALGVSLARRPQRFRTGMGTQKRLLKHSSTAEDITESDVCNFEVETNSEEGGTAGRSAQGAVEETYWLAELVVLGARILHEVPSETHRYGFRSFFGCVYAQDVLAFLVAHVGEVLAAEQQQRLKRLGRLGDPEGGGRGAAVRRAHEAALLPFVRQIARRAQVADAKTPVPRARFGQGLLDLGVVERAAAARAGGEAVSLAQLLFEELRAAGVLVRATKWAASARRQSADSVLAEQAATAASGGVAPRKRTLQQVASSAAGAPTNGLLRVRLPNPRSAVVGAEQLREAVVQRRRMLSADAARVHARDLQQLLQGRALGCLPASSAARQCLARLVTRPRFHAAVHAAIALSTVLLALDTPAMQRAEQRDAASSDAARELAQWLWRANGALTLFFVFEAGTKIVAGGLFFNGPGSYLRLGWNRLDLVVVVAAVLDFSGAASSGSLKALRTLRALRPLRAVGRAPGMRVVVKSIFAALPGVLSAGAIVVFFFFVFGTLSTQLFAGKLQFCHVAGGGAAAATVSTCLASCARYAMNETACAAHAPSASAGAAALAAALGCCGGDAGGGALQLRWGNPASFSFDNIGASMLALLEVSSLEGWTTMMYATTDIGGAWAPGAAPVAGGARRNALFFVVFICVGCFVVLNLFVSIVIARFQQLSDEENGSAFLTQGQTNWIEAQRLMLKLQPKRAVRAPPSPRCGMLCRLRLELCAWRRGAFRVVRSERFKDAITLLLCANALLLAAEHYPQAQGATDAIFLAQFGVAIAFGVELVLQLAGLGARQYWVSRWRRFDFFVTVSSLAMDGLMLYRERDRFGLGGTAAILANPALAEGEVRRARSSKTERRSCEPA